MGRRSDHSREELQELAVDAAAALIAEDGMEQFSARQVAARIGYTIGTIYNVFGTYENLLLHAQARTLDDWHAFLKDRLARRGKLDPIHALARGYIDYARTHYNSWSALFAREPQDQLPDWYQSKLQSLIGLAEDAIAPLLANDREKTQRAARVLWAGIHGLCVLSLSGKLGLVIEEPLEPLVTRLVDNYLHGEMHGPVASRAASKKR